MDLVIQGLGVSYSGPPTARVRRSTTRVKIAIASNYKKNMLVEKNSTGELLSSCFFDNCFHVQMFILWIVIGLEFCCDTVYQSQILQSQNPWSLERCLISRETILRASWMHPACSYIHIIPVILRCIWFLPGNRKTCQQHTVSCQDWAKITSRPVGPAGFEPQENFIVE